MAGLCDACGTDTANGRCGLCRYCALQAAEPAESDEQTEALAAERSSERWELVGELLLWLVPPAFLLLIVLADRLVHR
jgi:hypothetical protein